MEIKIVMPDEINMVMKLLKEGKNIKYNFQLNYKRFVLLKTGKCIIARIMKLKDKRVRVVLSFENLSKLIHDFDFQLYSFYI